MKNLVFIITAFIIIAVAACSDMEMKPVNKSSGKPEKVEILSTDSIVPGGVVINYRIPQDNDILSVKAVFTITNGQQRVESASFYTSYLALYGFNDEDEHEALIYTVNRSGDLSDPVTVKFRPGESPLNKAVRSMQILPDWGGVAFFWLNPDKSMLTFEFFGEDAFGEMATMRIISSKNDNSVGQTFRGYDSTPIRFAVIIRDNYGNSSEMIYPVGNYILPFPEYKLDKTKMKMVRLAGDSNWENWGGSDAYLIDDDTDTYAHTDILPAGGVFTVDFGVPVQLSRMLMWQRAATYYNGQPKKWELYTTDHTGDTPSGDWSAWELGSLCEVYKPSDSPLGTNTPDDLTAARLGLEASISRDMKVSRYIRVRITENFNPANYMWCPTEFTFYGFEVQ